MPGRFQRVDEIAELERLQRVSGGHDAIDHVSRHAPLERARVEIDKPVVPQDAGDRCREWPTSHSAVEPMTQTPVLSVPPFVDVGGECRIGPRIPGIDVHVIEVDHPTAMKA